MARSSNGSGYETLNLVIRVRLPYGLLTSDEYDSLIPDNLR